MTTTLTPGEIAQVTTDRPAWADGLRSGDLVEVFFVKPSGDYLVSEALGAEDRQPGWHDGQMPTGRRGWYVPAAALAPAPKVAKGDVVRIVTAPSPDHVGKVGRVIATPFDGDGTSLYYRVSVDGGRDYYPCIRSEIVHEAASLAVGDVVKVPADAKTVDGHPHYFGADLIAEVVATAQRGTGDVQVKRLDGFAEPWPVTQYVDPLALTKVETGPETTFVFDLEGFAALGEGAKVRRHFLTHVGSTWTKDAIGSLSIGVTAERFFQPSNLVAIEVLDAGAPLPEPGPEYVLADTVEGLEALGLGAKVAVLFSDGQHSTAIRTKREDGLFWTEGADYGRTPGALIRFFGRLVVLDEGASVEPAVPERGTEVSFWEDTCGAGCCGETVSGTFVGIDSDGDAVVLVEEDGDFSLEYADLADLTV